MMAIAALVAWVLTASIGVYMLRTWVARGGLRRQRATGVGVPPAVVFGHASAALTGLVIWAGFVKTKWDPLAWLGVALITGPSPWASARSPCGPRTRSSSPSGPRLPRGRAVLQAAESPRLKPRTP